MDAIQAGQQIQLLPLTLRRHSFRVVEILDWHPFRTELHALIHSWHESGAPIAHSIDDATLAVFQDHKGWQILVLRAQTIGDPGP